MATVVTFFNGYEIFPYCPNGSNEGIAFNEYVAPLSDGFRQQALYGANTGTRIFTLQLQNLAGGSYDNTISLNNTLMNPATYVWDLFCRTKVSGTPFIVKSPINDQYYLAEFADSNLSYERALQKLFSTGLNLRQVRLSGETVFDVSKVSQVSHWYKTPITGATDNTTLPSDIWNNETGGEDLQSANCTYQTNEQNGNAIVRLDQSGTADSLGTQFASVPFYEAFLVLKCRETTFAEHRGIISNNHSTDGSPALLGADATTKFFDLGFGSGYTYRKNGIEYPESNQQAPMNVFGLVHIRLTTGWTMADGLVFGRDRPGTFPERDADLDFGEIIICDELLPESVGLEVEEYLISRWGI